MGKTKNFYYKLINNKTNEVDFVVCSDAEANTEKLCDFLQLNDYTAVQITKYVCRRANEEKGRC